ncbi:PH domain-containing protein [Nonomuraea sp. N2-4H]|uniref:PH domain-containing protein n=1 Tax=Nonomuraea sp. N2-4H TaxID=3128898 RepID=UPI0032471B60
MTGVKSLAVAAGAAFGLVRLLTGLDLPPGGVVAACAGAAVLIVAAAVAYDVLRLRTTRWRLTPERLELRSGITTRRHRAVPRDRVRSVDLRADPVRRVFGLTVVKVGTGEHAGDEPELALDPLTRHDAEALRRALLHQGETAESCDGPLAELRWSWIRYAPLSVWTFTGTAALLAALFKMFDSFGLKNVTTRLARELWEWVVTQPLLAIPLLLAVHVVVGVAGAMLLFAESWGRYRLDREPGRIRLRRGLLTTRSLTLEERRLRGVELHEPLLLRLAGAARVKTIATGLAKTDDEDTEDTAALTPPLPRATALHIATAVATHSPLASVPARPPSAPAPEALDRAWAPVPVSGRPGLAPAPGLPPRVPAPDRLGDGSLPAHQDPAPDRLSDGPLPGHQVPAPDRLGPLPGHQGVASEGAHPGGPKRPGTAAAPGSAAVAAVAEESDLARALVAPVRHPVAALRRRVVRALAAAGAVAMLSAGLVVAVRAGAVPWAEGLIGAGMSGQSGVGAGSVGGSGMGDDAIGGSWVGAGAIGGDWIGAGAIGGGWIVAAVAVPVAVLAYGLWLAVAGAANLGHALSPRHLITRRGAVVRRTVALDRRGVAGWTFTETFFQRRSGLLTVSATTAAGRGHYEVVDVGRSDGLDLAAATVPGLLDPFLVREAPSDRRTSVRPRVPPGPRSSPDTIEGLTLDPP